MGEYRNALMGMMLSHQQRERKESGETPVVWFVDSHPEDDKQRVKAELSNRVQEATGELVDPESYRVGWTTIKIEGAGEATHAIAILAEPELHNTLERLFMKMSQQTNTHTHQREITHRTRCTPTKSTWYIDWLR